MGFVSFLFFGYAFSKTSSGSLTNYAVRSIWRVRQKSSLMTLESSHPKLKVSLQYFPAPLNIYLYTRSWAKSISRTLFNSEFKSFYDSAIQSIKLGIRRRIKRQFFFFLNKYANVEEEFCIFGGFPNRQNWTKLNKLFPWFIDSKRERYSICSKILWNKLGQPGAKAKEPQITEILGEFLKINTPLNITYKGLLNGFALKYHLCIISEWVLSEKVREIDGIRSKWKPQVFLACLSIHILVNLFFDI